MDDTRINCDGREWRFSWFDGGATTVISAPPRLPGWLLHLPDDIIETPITFNSRPEAELRPLLAGWPRDWLDCGARREFVVDGVR